MISNTKPIWYSNMHLCECESVREYSINAYKSQAWFFQSIYFGRTKLFRSGVMCMGARSQFTLDLLIWIRMSDRKSHTIHLFFIGFSWSLPAFAACNIFSSSLLTFVIGTRGASATHLYSYESMHTYMSRVLCLC